MQREESSNGIQHTSPILFLAYSIRIPPFSEVASNCLWQKEKTHGLFRHDRLASLIFYILAGLDRILLSTDFGVLIF